MSQLDEQNYGGKTTIVSAIYSSFLKSGVGFHRGQIAKLPDVDECSSCDVYLFIIQNNESDTAQQTAV